MTAELIPAASNVYVTGFRIQSGVSLPVFVSGGDLEVTVENGIPGQFISSSSVSTFDAVSAWLDNNFTTPEGVGYTVSFIGTTPIGRVLRGANLTFTGPQYPLWWHFKVKQFAFNEGTGFARLMDSVVQLCWGKFAQATPWTIGVAVAM